MEFNIIPILIFIFWFFHILRRTLFFLYLWQLKEYRLDRFWEEAKRRKPLVFSKFFFLSIGTLALWMFFGAIDLFLVQGFLIFALVLLFFLYSFYLIIKRQWHLPVWTKKMILLFTFTTVAEIWLAAVFLERELLIFILLFEVFFLLFIFFCLQIIQIPVFLTKKFIIKKAKKKIQAMSDLIVIGITGSYGKTSTKEFLTLFLSQKYKVLKTKGNINVDIGIANFILKELKKKHEIFICEMGAYKKGEVKDICDIVRPKIGIVTGVNEQHLALFGSMENLLLAEGGGKLIDSLPSDGVVFFNGKNEYCRDLYQKTNIKKFLYGESAAFPGGENILGAMAVAKELGVTEEELNRVAEKIKNKFPGIETKKGVNGLTIIDATYSANPTGVMAHLEYLKVWPGKKIIVMPCLIELGEASKRIHRKIGEKISEVCDLAIITTKDRFKEIKEGAGEKAIFMEKPKEIFEKIMDLCGKEGDVALLESRMPDNLIERLIP